MKIRLIRTGGFLPLKKAAEAETDLTGEEMNSLLSVIRADPSAPRVKDGTQYLLEAGDRVTRVNLDNVPEKYRDLFEKLKNDLKVVRQNPPNIG